MGGIKRYNIRRLFTLTYKKAFSANQMVAGKKIGSATMALRLVKALYESSFKGQTNNEMKEDINIMITYRCPFDCDSCFAKKAMSGGGKKEMDKATFLSIIDQFNGFKKIHIVGTGEPLTYGKKNIFDEGLSEDFKEIVNYAAQKISEVRIVTNGYLIPQDADSARAFFKSLDFPSNLVWIISVDEDHEKEMARRMKGKSLRDLIRTLEMLEQEGLIKAAYNMRLVHNTQEEREKALAHFGLKDKAKQADRIFINSFIAYGNPKNTPGKRLDIRDIRFHTRYPESFIYFIDPEGNLVPDHFAYMDPEDRKKIASANPSFQFHPGNIHDEKLSDLIIDKYFFNTVVGVFFSRTGLGDACLNTNKKFYSTKNMSKMIRAVLWYADGDVAAAKRAIEDFREKDGFSAKTLAGIAFNILYFMQSNLEGMDMELTDSFFSEVFNKEDLLNLKDFVKSF